MNRKRIAIFVLVVALLSLALAPESLACRHYRTYVRPAAYCNYRTYRRPAAYYYVPRARVSGVAYYHHGHSTRNKILTVLAPAAVGAGVGALAGGGKGAGIGALVGAGGGAAYYLIKHRHRY